MIFRAWKLSPTTHTKQKSAWYRPHYQIDKICTLVIVGVGPKMLILKQKLQQANTGKNCEIGEGDTVIFI